jgi:DNA polymerase elongation subunit (family B)
MVSAVRASLGNGQPLLFMPTSFAEKDVWGAHPQYKVFNYGTLLCGSKTCVILTNIPVYFDVRYGPCADASEKNRALDLWRGRLLANNIQYARVEDVLLYDSKGFQQKPMLWVRLHFMRLFDRKAALKYVENMPGVVTASDDLSYKNYYYPKVAREHKFATADWNRLEKYKVLTTSYESVADVTNCRYVIEVDVCNYIKLSGQKRAQLSANQAIGGILERDNTMLSSWDIETYREIQNGIVPQPTDTDYTVFMICSTHQWQHTSTPMLSVCITNNAMSARAGVDIAIVCDTEREVLDAHIQILGKMRPEILVAFNGSNFDWPLVREKMYREGLLVKLCRTLSCMAEPTSERYKYTEESVYKYSFRNEKMKMDAETDAYLKCVAGFPGLLDIDVSPIYQKIYIKQGITRARSLNFYLECEGLAPKEDMAYRRMFKIYERARMLKSDHRPCHCGEKCGHCGDAPEPSQCCKCTARDEMAEIGYYCVVDCMRPQDLLIKRAIVADKRELSNMSCMPLYDSFYRADGQKVRNLIGKQCFKQGIAFSNKARDAMDHEKDHYPGAWVFPPIRGLNTRRPTTGIDFQSLYPSLMITYNLSIDMLVYTEQQAQELIAAGYTLHRIEPFDYEIGVKKGDSANKRATASGWTVRHNGISPTNDKIITGWTSLGEPIYGREKLPGERMGIFPTIVKTLFDKRVPIKREVIRLTKILEKIDQRMVDSCEIDGKTYVKSDVIYARNKVDAKQKAIKVLSNTFYGESGNFRSPVYELLVAAGVTCAGQASIKLVAAEVARLGYITHYGDTDSLYVECPAELYKEVDAEYAEICSKHGEDTPADAKVAARVKYWTGMVQLTMKDIELLRKHVNDMLMHVTCTRSLNMSYEEVGFPTFYAGKKKYMFTPHMASINFYPREYFIKGMEFIKHDCPAITKRLCLEVTQEALSPENDREMIDIVRSKIEKFYATAINVKDFALMARYKPHKKNIPVLTFVDRMATLYKNATADKAPLYEPPEAGDKFEYVMVKKAQEYTLNGNMIKLSNGQRMEYVRVFEESQKTYAPMEIDLNFYMKKRASMVFARFISHYPQFDPKMASEDSFDINNKEQYKLMDEARCKAAQKYINTICDEITNSSGKTAAVIGSGYRKIYNNATKQLSHDLRVKVGGPALLIKTIDVHNTDMGINKHIVEQLKNTAAEFALDHANDGKLMMPLITSIGVFKARRLLVMAGGPIPAKIARCNDRERSIVARLYEMTPKLFDILLQYENNVRVLIDDLRAKGGPGDVEDTTLAKLNTLDEASLDVLGRVYDASLELCAVYGARASAQSLMDAIEKERAALSNDYSADIMPGPTIIADVPEYNWA